MDSLRDFLLPRESACVSVTECLPGAPTTARRHGRFTVFADHTAVQACIFHTPQGFVFPVLPEDGLPEPEGLARKLRGLGTILFCIMGLRRDVESLQSLLTLKTVETIHYFHMARRCGTPLDLEPVPDGMTIRRATLSDANALYPIQRDYEIEEVILSPERFEPNACMSQLRSSLRKQLVYAAELEGRIVAKAQTNARGIHWDQIGGVYTVPELRGRGVGGAAMRKLLRDVERENRHSSLFVKQKNESALRMYRRLGYSTSDEFTIAYYQST